MSPSHPLALHVLISLASLVSYVKDFLFSAYLNSASFSKSVFSALSSTKNSQTTLSEGSSFLL